MPYNAPDDWNSYYSDCSDCGERIHGSENHNCEEEMEEEMYTIVVYLRVDIDDPETMTYDDAEAEVKHLELMHPDNKYEIQEVEND